MVPCPERSRLAPWRPEVATPGAISGASGNTPQGRERSRCWAGPHWPTKAALKWEENGGWMGMYHGEIMRISWKSVVYQLRMRILCAYSWDIWLDITNQLIPTWRETRVCRRMGDPVYPTNSPEIMGKMTFLAIRFCGTLFSNKQTGIITSTWISFACKMRGNYKNRKFPQMAWKHWENRLAKRPLFCHVGLPQQPLEGQQK